jgi:hypothetical protein
MFTIINNARCRRLVGGLKFKQVPSPGNSIASFAIDEFDRLWSWGNNWELGSASQGNPRASGWSWAEITVLDNFQISVPRIVEDINGHIKSDWVKIMSGEFSTIAMNESGELWGCGQPFYSGLVDGNCACFGLPHDSGEDMRAWQEGVDPIDGHQMNFYNLTRCAPGWTFKDFMHNYYYTHMIGQDNLLYGMGWETGGAYGGGFGTGNVQMFYDEPTRLTIITDPIKLILADGDWANLGGVVTQDNRVLVWGNRCTMFDPAYDGDVEYVLDITAGLPAGAVIKEFYGSWASVLVLLENGEVWGISNYDFYLGMLDGYAPHVWFRVPLEVPIRTCGLSQSAPWAIDTENRLWTWGWADYGCADPSYPSSDVPCMVENYRWNAITFNQYHGVWIGVLTDGRLMTWGRNSAGPHLGLGTFHNWDYNNRYGIEESPVWQSYVPVMPRYDSGEMLVNDIYDILFAVVPRPYER